MNSYLPDIGTVISLNTGATLTGATVTIEVKRPDGTTVSWPSTVDVDGQSVDHTIVAGDFTVSGAYTLQAKVVSGANIWYGASVKLLVEDLFN